ncbi:MAG TPA: AAA family ATPase [Azospirillum sp.]|nr:AAA family ATPase [Azospirillum sp.]
MTQLLSVLALTRTEGFADEVRRVCAGLAGVRLDTRTRTPQAVAAAEAAPDRILLVECRADQPEERQALSRLVQAGGPPVVAVVQDATIGDVRDLMRLGLADVLPRPLAADDLGQALEHARRRIEALPRNLGRVYSFLRSCGGAGATTLALQMAMDLLQRDARKGAKVCLLDFDLQFGNAGLALDLKGPAGLKQILEASSRLDGALFASAMAHHESGLDVLTTPGEIMPFEALGIDLVEQILALAREQYDHVVIDLPHAWTGWTPSVLAGSSLVSLVLRPTVSGVQRARCHLRLMAEEQLDHLPKLVVANGVEQGWGSGWRRRLREAMQALDHEIAVTVRRDDETADAARENGKPLRAIKRNSVIEKDVHALVDRALAMTEAAAPRTGAAAPAAPSASFLSALLSVPPLKTAR